MASVEKQNKPRVEGQQTTAATQPGQLQSPPRNSGAELFVGRYKVNKGDTLSGIAKRYQTSIDELRKLNPDQKGDGLRVGQFLIVPRAEVHQGDTVRYKVAAGDKLSKLAGDPAAQERIKRLNPGIDWDRLPIGTVLTIPKGVAAAGKPFAELPSRQSQRELLQREFAPIEALKSALDKEGKSFVMTVNSVHRPEAVRGLQNLLRMLGYEKADEPFASDKGRFGEATRKAVARFQDANSEAVDGKVGGATYLALREEVYGKSESRRVSEVVAQAVKADAPIAMPAGILGRSAETYTDKDRLFVTQLCTLLRDTGFISGVEARNVFNDRLRTAVQQFQKSAGLPVTGVPSTETVSRLMEVRHSFDRSLETLDSVEGKLANLANDPGGLTNYGVTQATYDSWRQKKGLATREVTDITSSEVVTLYREAYWNLLHCNRLPAGFNLMVFDTAVLQGPEAAKVIRQQLEASARGEGGQTEAEMIQALEAAAGTRIEQLSKKDYGYLKGWKNRVNKVLESCRKLVRETYS